MTDNWVQQLKLLDYFPTIVWLGDLEKNCAYYNRSCLEFTGMDISEGLGEGWKNLFEPDELVEYFQTFSSAFDRLASFEFEHHLRRFDGEMRWCLSVGKPYYDTEGKFCGYIGTVYDISERKQTEELLKRYRVLLEKARDIIFFIAADGKIIEANEAAVEAYGYTHDELISKSIIELRASAGLTLNQLRQAREEGVFFETIHRRKDGSLFPVEVSSQMINFGDKSVLISIVRDITERKQVEIKLKEAKDLAEEANRAKSQFLANMSHEIRTPLNGMIGMIDLTLLTGLDDEQRENLLTAKNCANSLLKIINDILDFAKMEAGKMTIESINFDLKQLVTETIKTHAPIAYSKGLQLYSSVAAEIPQFLIGDPNRLQQVLHNLIGNAIKFTDKGEVHLAVEMVSAESAGQEDDGGIELKFSVADTGIGISIIELSKLFKSFCQLDGSFTKKHSGTGLGLVISRQFVEMMGGMMWVDSRQGKGSTFYFTIQLKVGKKIEPKVWELKPITKTTNPLHILLAEDDLINQKVLQQMLKEKGHTVDVVSNGLEVIGQVGEGTYDLILMDIQMPKMDGIEAAKNIRIRQTETGEYTPIIAMTAYALPGDRERFMAMGLDEYLSKPVHMEELYTMLTAFSEKKVENRISGVRLTADGEVVFVEKNDEYLTAELLPTIEQIAVAIGELQQHTNDISAIEIAAHVIKELATGVGLDELKSAAFRVELAARRGNPLEVKEYITRLANNFEIHQKRYGRRKN